MTYERETEYAPIPIYTVCQRTKWIRIKRFTLTHCLYSVIPCVNKTHVKKIHSHSYSRIHTYTTYNGNEKQYCFAVCLNTDKKSRKKQTFNESTEYRKKKLRTNEWRIRQTKKRKRTWGRKRSCGSYETVEHFISHLSVRDKGTNRLDYIESSRKVFSVRLLCNDGEWRYYVFGIFVILNVWLLLYHFYLVAVFARLAIRLFFKKKKKLAKWNPLLGFFSFASSNFHID